ncbi:MAG TPA: hypothetical protein ENI23_17235 [bacterium]|nr:hypothetical protein [bacterium]
MKNTMRLVKYNAWHKKHKRMFGVMAIHFNPGADEVLFLGEGWEGIAGKDVIPLEYISVKDKRGHEIYEGDVLMKESSRNNPRYKVTRKVYKEVKWIHTKRYLGFNIVKGDNQEIVGNIYENPELLKPHLQPK